MSLKDEVEITVRLTAAFFANQTLSPDQALEFLSRMHAQVKAVFYTQPTSETLVTCVCCGQKMRTLRKHLRVKHNLSVEQYLAKYNLPKDTPLTAATYSSQRQDIAKRHGLGITD